MEVNETDFERLVVYVKHMVGINLEGKETLAVARLNNHINALGCISLGEYLDLVSNDITGKESEKLINFLTTNHTYFWREERHFEYMHSVVLPTLRDRCSSERDIRIWCAASSTGEEPYTLAMLMEEYFAPLQDEWDTTILATDVSTAVLETAAIGRYPADSIQSLPIAWQQRYFKKEGEWVAIKDELKQRVLFRRLNLIDAFPFKKKLHIIFARNVLIYFDDQIKKNVIEKMTDVLEDGGYLFIGTTESVGKMNDRLQCVAPSVYIKKY